VGSDLGSADYLEGLWLWDICVERGDGDQWRRRLSGGVMVTGYLCGKG
jgi:hypothetical protein